MLEIGGDAKFNEPAKSPAQITESALPEQATALDCGLLSAGSKAEDTDFIHFPFPAASIFTKYNVLEEVDSATRPPMPKLYARKVVVATKISPPEFEAIALNSS